MEDMLVTQRIAGHSSIKMTQHYADKGSCARRLSKPKDWDRILGSPENGTLGDGTEKLG